MQRRFSTSSVASTVSSSRSSMLSFTPEERVSVNSKSQQPQPQPQPQEPAPQSAPQLGQNMGQCHYCQTSFTLFRRRYICMMCLSAVCPDHSHKVRVVTPDATSKRRLCNGCSRNERTMARDHRRRSMSSVVVPDVASSPVMVDQEPAPVSLLQLWRESQMSTSSPTLLSGIKDDSNKCLMIQGPTVKKGRPQVRRSASSPSITRRPQRSSSNAFYQLSSALVAEHAQHSEEEEEQAEENETHSPQLSQCNTTQEKMFVMAKSYYDAAEYKKAVTWCKRGMKQDQGASSTELLHLCSKSYSALGEYDLAGEMNQQVRQSFRVASTASSEGAQGFAWAEDSSAPDECLPTLQLLDEDSIEYETNVMVL